MRVKNILKSRKGFTLVELVVVIAILGILATMAILKFNENTMTAKGARLIADMRTIESAAVIYNASTGTWPTILSSTGVSQDQTPNKEFSTKYLNGMPLPPTGKFIIQGYNNVRYTYEFKNQKCYGYYNYGDNTNSQTTR